MNPFESLSDEAKKQLKATLLNHCIDLKKDQLQELDNSLSSIKDSVESNDKSSAGDKHETSRENANQTLLIYGAQRKKAMDDFMLLNLIKSDVICDKVQIGTVVVINDMLLYIAEISVRATINDLVFNVVPPNGPLLKEIMGKEVGYSFNFNNLSYQILEVF